MARKSECFPEIVDLRLPGFEQSVPPGSVGQLSFNRRVAAEWYASFVDIISGAIGHRHLPVYRMADGEFIFCVGRRADLPPKNAGWAERLRFDFRRALLPVRRWVPLGQKTCWGEHYSGISQEELMGHYRRCLRSVADAGLLAVHFTRSAGRFAEQYVGPMCEWFAQHQIVFSIENYMPFYFIYALLSGPDAGPLVADRRVLIVTHASADKQHRIASTLNALGAADVQFLQISSSRSLLDRLDLDRVEPPVDIALVAGGIGTVNLLDQLAPIRTVCLDAGICMEIFADRSRRGRIFTVPDHIGWPHPASSGAVE